MYHIKRKIKSYVALIEKKIQDEFVVNFLKQTGPSVFQQPERVYRDSVNPSQIIQVLGEPQYLQENRKMILKFDES